MIAHSEIELGEDLSTFQLFEQLSYVRKWIFVPDCLLVQWMVIDKQSVHAILLLDKQNSTAPRRLAWSDQTQMLLLIEFS